MATLQPGQVTIAGQIGPNGGTATIDELGFMHHPDFALPCKTNDTGESGVSAPTGGLATPATTGGTIVHSTATSYKVTALTAGGESTPSSAVTATTGAGTDTNKVTVSWTAVPGATGYKVYGRTDSAWGLLGSPSASPFVDDGSGTPGASPPVTNTSGALPTGVEGPSHIIGATIGSGLVRPIVDTRNATNVGDATGPDAVAPLVYGPQ